MNNLMVFPSSPQLLSRLLKRCKKRENPEIAKIQNLQRQKQQVCNPE